MTSKDYLSQNLARNYGSIAQKYYGYRVSVIDLRNPTRSDGNNLLTLINRYMDLARKDPTDLSAHAKAEETVQKYLNKLKSCKLNMARLNKLRELAGNCKIANR